MENLHKINSQNSIIEASVSKITKRGDISVKSTEKKKLSQILQDWEKKKEPVMSSIFTCSFNLRMEYSMV